MFENRAACAKILQQKCFRLYLHQRSCKSNHPCLSLRFVSFYGSSCHIVMKQDAINQPAIGSSGFQSRGAIYQQVLVATAM